MNIRGMVPSFCLALSLLATTAGEAAAHGDLKSSTPADKARLSVIPRQLRLTFTERPEMALTRIVLRGPGGQAIVLGKLSASGADMATVSADITGSMSAGVYTVEWEIAGADGHPVDGKFTFTLLPEALSPGVPASDSVRAAQPDSQVTHHDSVSMPLSADRFDAESGGYVVIRFFLYASLLVVIGAVAFRFVVLSLVGRQPQPDTGFIAEATKRAAAIGRIAAVGLIVACLARLFAQSMALGGTGMADSARLSSLLFATNWGKSWIVQLITAVIAFGGFHFARRRGDRDGGVDWTVAGLAALVLAFTPAFASHAASVPDRAGLAILADGLHVLGASGWLGSLLVVLAAGIPAAMSLGEGRRGTAVAELINSFSPTALVFAGLVAGTGVFAAWQHLGSVSALWESTYGRLLLAKLVVLSAVALTGAYNWLRVRPSLGSDEGVARIRRSASVEVAVAVLVLAVTAVLVATPTPMDGM